MNDLHHRGNNSSPLFLLQNGQPLSRDKFCTWLRDATTHIGETGHYSGHSFRIGAATTAAAVGIPDHLINTGSLD
jgi:site-specific recombinase XerD